MPPQTSAKPGCFTRLFRWGLAGIGLLVAFGIVANLLPSSDPPDQPIVTPNFLVETRPAATTAPTETPQTIENVVPTAAQIATQPSLPTDAPTAVPSTATPLPQTTANRDANLRGGPGTDFQIVGGVVPGQALAVVATSPDRAWMQLDNGAWIAAFLIDNLQPNLPVAASIPAAPASPTNTPLPVVVQPTLEPMPTAPPAPTATPIPAVPQPEQSCDPSYPDFCLQPGIPDLDCKDVPYRRFRVLPPDPHGFDGNDNDGLGCESN